MAATPIFEDTAFRITSRAAIRPCSPGQRMLSPMRLALAILFTTLSATAQTADRSASPPPAATNAPAARPGSYSLQNGELVVAPGLRIPNGNVPWALDMVDGKQTLVPIHHTPLEGTATTGTLDGATSHTPLHTSSPAFFVHSSDRTENSGDSGRGTPTGWALLPVTVTDGNRNVERPHFSDVSSATVCTDPVICTTAETLPDGWLRITPAAPLTAGEYALLPIQKPPATPTSTLAYDFTINTAQPTARDAVSPGQNLDTKKKKKH